MAGKSTILKRQVDGGQIRYTSIQNVNSPRSLLSVTIEAASVVWIVGDDKATEGVGFLRQLATELNEANRKEFTCMKNFQYLLHFIISINYKKHFGQNAQYSGGRAKHPRCPTKVYHYYL